MSASLLQTRKSPAEGVAALSGEGRGKVRCLICMWKCHGGEGEAAGSGAKPLPGGGGERSTETPNELLWWLIIHFNLRTLFSGLCAAEPRGENLGVKCENISTWVWLKLPALILGRLFSVLVAAALLLLPRLHCQFSLFKRSQPKCWSSSLSPS